MKTEAYQPISLTTRQVQALRKKGMKVLDQFSSQSEELFMARNPSYRFRPKEQRDNKPKLPKDSWFYYPWRDRIVRLLNKNDFFELRTARNKNLISKTEQENIRTAAVGIIGLSVGNSILSALSLEGFENFYLADADTLSLSNLNRIKASVLDLGLNKTKIAARQIYELNPYAKVVIFPQGINNERELIKFTKNLDIIVDEMDDVGMKIKLRWHAKKIKLPVVSAADNGDNSVVDVERFDLFPKRPIYHGLLKNLQYEKIESLNFSQKFELINSIVGVKFVTSRMKQSLLQVGKTLYSWPQLGGAAQLSGAAVVYLVKAIVLKQKIKSGKYDVNLERIFVKNFDSKSNKLKRNKETQRFMNLQAKL